MLLLTDIGAEIFFLLVIVVLYWCVNKRLAYKFFNVYLLSTVVNTGLKAIIKRPRPFDGYPDTINSIGDKTSGYSFPSGHSQSISNIAAQGVILSKTYRKAFLIMGIVLTIIVMVTRLYLGQHYLTDVIAGAALGILLAVVFSRLFELLKDKEEWLFVGIAPLCLIVLVILLIVSGKSANADVMKVLGAYLAFSVGYFVEKRYIKFDPCYEKSTKKLWKNAVKILVGLSIGFAIKECFKLFLPIDNTFLYDFFRYFCIAAWASLGATSLFKALKL